MVGGQSDADVIGKHDQQRLIVGIRGAIGYHRRLNEYIVKTVFQVLLGTL